MFDKRCSVGMRGLPKRRSQGAAEIESDIEIVLDSEEKEHRPRQQNLVSFFRTMIFHIWPDGLWELRAISDL